MLVANFVTNRPTMSDTRTYEDFSKFLGKTIAPIIGNNYQLLCENGEALHATGVIPQEVSGMRNL